MIFFIILFSWTISFRFTFHIKLENKLIHLLVSIRNVTFQIWEMNEYNFLNVLLLLYKTKNYLTSFNPPYTLCHICFFFCHFYLYIHVLIFFYFLPILYLSTRDPFNGSLLNFSLDLERTFRPSQYLLLFLKNAAQQLHAKIIQLSST